MYSEIAAILVGSAAGSGLTYWFVTRRIAFHFDALIAELKTFEPLLKKYASALDATAKVRFEDLKVTQIETIAKHVELEVRSACSSALAKTCDFCGGIVARFENHDDKIKCVNCKNAGK